MCIRDRRHSDEAGIQQPDDRQKQAKPGADGIFEVCRDGCNDLLPQRREDEQQEDDPGDNR